MFRKRDLMIFIPVMIYLLFFYYFPMLYVLKDAFIKNEKFTVDIFLSLFQDKSVLFSIIFSFWEAIISVILCVILGIPIAYILTKYDFPGKELFTSLIMIPFILPGVVVGYSIIVLYGINGIFTNIIRSLTGMSIVLGRGLPGIFIAHTFYNASLVALITSSVWRRVDPEIEEAARTLGSSGLHKFFKITLPLIAPGLLSSALIVFLFCFTSFEIILILGGAMYRTIEVEIYTLYLAFFDFNKAAALSLFQLIVVSIITLIYLRQLAKATELRKTGKIVVYPTKPLVRSFRDIFKPQKIVVILYLALYSIFIFSPLVVLGVSAFYDPVTDSFSLKGFEALFSNKYNTFLGAAPVVAPLNTLIYSFVTVIIVFIISIFSAKLMLDRRLFSLIFGLLMFLPVATSRITIGLAMVASYGKLGLLSMDPRPIIVAAHTIIAYPFATRTLLNGLTKIDPEVVNAARTLGAEGIFRIKKVDIPLIKPSIISAIALSFSISVGEFAATSILYRGKYATLTIFLYLMIGARKFIVANAAAFLLILMTLLTFIIIVKSGEDISASI